MNFKVLLTMLPFSNHVFTPPLPLAYLKASIQQINGVEVKTLDLETICFKSSAIKKDRSYYWKQVCEGGITSTDKIFIPYLEHCIEELLIQTPKVVGFSVTNSNFLFTHYVTQRLKQAAPNTYIVYGGRRYCLRKKWRYLIHDQLLALPDVDCIVKNEGEITFAEIITKLKLGKVPEFCPGALVRFNGKVVDGGERPLIKNLDDIPFPDFSDFNKEDYLSDYIRILLSRGCSGQCSYCAENDTMGAPVRYRNPKNIVEEIKLRIRQGYTRFQTCDLSLSSNIAYLEDLCRSIIEENLDIEFTFAEFRHSPRFNKKTFSLLCQAGFKTAVFGTESGSQTILNKMKKGIKVQTIDQNLKDATKAGMESVLYLMVGFPGETEETFTETLEMIKRNKDYISSIGFAAPTNICGETGIHESLEEYDVNIDTVFQNPDRWKSKDGTNNYEWRLELSRRLYAFIPKLGIPLVCFLKDGNPSPPSMALRIPKPERSCGPGLLRKKFLFPLKESLEYRSVLSITQATSPSSAKFVLKITNSGKKSWTNDQHTWIRVGYRIFSLNKSRMRSLYESRQELPKDPVTPNESFFCLFVIEDDILPPGRYQVRFDMLDEYRCWFEELGSSPVIEYIQIS